jgi:transketolase
MNERVKPIATRQAFGEALAAAGERWPNVVVLEADLAKSTRSELFAKRFPDRFFEMGIAEQNMIGVAAGLALSGKTPFCCSFACFVAGRVETVRMSVGYSRACVRLVGTHTGIGTGPDGYSHMAIEDLGAMRVLPTMRIFQPADDLETAQIVQYLCENREGPAYLRLTRQELARFHSADYRFEPGKLETLREGTEVAIFATGATVIHALEAADRLDKDGVKAAVVNVATIKPLDPADVQRWAERTPLIVTAEDHNVVGGMGSAVAEIAAELGKARVVRHGIYDRFAESGNTKELYRKFKLDAAGIAEVVLNSLRVKTA